MASRRERRKMRRRGKTPGEKEEPEEQVVETKKRKRNSIQAFYEDYYKQLLIIPFLMLIVSMVVIGFQIAETGDFVDKDVTLQGGLTINILTTQELSTEQLETQLLQQFPQSDIRVRSITDLGQQTGLIVEASDVTRDEITDFLAGIINNFEENHSVESIGPALGESFFQQTMLAIIVAFLFMSLVVFYYFRTLVPSLAVVLAAFSDMVVTIAVLNIMDIRLSTAGIAALLMLIGYSVDTDILLSTRVLKRKEGSLMERMYSAIKTGLTMNITTLTAITVALIFSQSETISQIMTILLIGLIVDIINTWIQNVGILRMYVEGKHE